RVVCLAVRLCLARTLVNAARYGESFVRRGCVASCSVAGRRVGSSSFFTCRQIHSEATTARKTSTRQNKSAADSMPGMVPPPDVAIKPLGAPTEGRAIDSATHLRGRDRATLGAGKRPGPAADTPGARCGSPPGILGGASGLFDTLCFCLI